MFNNPQRQAIVNGFALGFAPFFMFGVPKQMFSYEEELNDYPLPTVENAWKDVGNHLRFAMSKIDLELENAKLSHTNK
jgi:hypothetical protein